MINLSRPHQTNIGAAAAAAKQTDKDFNAFQMGLSSYFFFSSLLAILLRLPWNPADGQANGYSLARKEEEEELEVEGACST